MENGKTIIPGMCFFSPQKRNSAFSEDVVIKYLYGRLIRHSYTHMERQQMLFTGMAISCRRGFLPLYQNLLALSLGYLVGNCFSQPVLEFIIGGVRRIASLAEKCPHIVERKTGTDDQDVIMHQFAQRFAKRYM